MSQPTISDFASEDRLFPPPPAFQAAALAGDDSLYDEAEADLEAFWARQARELLTWSSDFDTILEWELPDRQVVRRRHAQRVGQLPRPPRRAGRGDKVAFHWEGEPGDTRTITYADLLDEVSRFANVLKGLGVERGDRVAIYMPMIPELPVAHAGLHPHRRRPLGDLRRLLARLDRRPGQRRRLQGHHHRRRRLPPRGARPPLKPNVDEALAVVPDGHRRRWWCGAPAPRSTMVEGRDHWYHDLMADASADCPPEPMDSEDLLFLLYTSGTTAKPKGIMHTTGGYLTQVAFTHKYVFDLKPDDDVYWCAADIGWVTGHSYIVYGPLANGATSVIYEGTPDTPGKDRLWDIVERYGVTQLYTAPTAIRMFMKWGDRGAREARPVVAAAARHGRRAHQPRGVDVVPHPHRRRAAARSSTRGGRPRPAAT